MASFAAIIDDVITRALTTNEPSAAILESAQREIDSKGIRVYMSSSARLASSAAFRLDGRHALVTGGASGIGEATVKELVRAGAFVWIADINLAAAEALAKSLGSSQALHLDVTSPESIASAVSQHRPPRHPRQQRRHRPRRLHRANRTRRFRPPAQRQRPRRLPRHPRLSSAAARRLRNTNGLAGTIVNIASVAGLVGIKQRFAYCTTKGAVVAMTRQLAVEYPKTLRVNAICPGTVETPFVEGYLEKFHKHNKEEVRAELRARQPIGRLGRPEEVASMVRYLASDEAAFITGSLFNIDGGWTAA